MRIFSVPVLFAALAVAGCTAFDPIDMMQDWDLLSSKKPLPGERRAVFPEGVPGVPQGVPPDMVKGYQPPPEAPPPVIEAKQPRQKAKRTASAPRRAAPPPQQEELEEAPAAQQPTRTQPVQQGSGGWQTMPGAQPTWPAGAQPAPTR
jgi:hypothetical protein